MATVTTHPTSTDALRDARRELKRAEAALAKAQAGSAYEALAQERVDAASVRYIALSGPRPCRGTLLETAQEHLAHAGRTSAH